jgi:hypothetical protein
VHGLETYRRAAAGHLQQLCERFDPPLFRKRDNGGDPNHPAANQVVDLMTLTQAGGDLLNIYVDTEYLLAYFTP